MYYNKKNIVMLLVISLILGCTDVDSTNTSNNNDSSSRDATENHAPTVSNIFIEGSVQTSKVLTVNYTFTDEDDDHEGNTTIVWRTENTQLQSGSSKTFLIPEGHVGEIISVYVYPEDEHGRRSDIKYEASNNIQIIMDIQNENKFSSAIPVWIIGDSTVSDYPESSTYRGWGQLLKPMFKNAKRVHNHARSGASSKSYVLAEGKENSFWGDGNASDENKGLKQIILEANTTSGGYLLIQFGHNDFYDHIRTYKKNKEKRTVPGIGNEFDTELMKYINFAKVHNVTPILITPVSIMYQDVSRHGHSVEKLDKSTPDIWKDMIGKKGDWPQTMIDIAKRENVILLDLTKHSKKHFHDDFDNDDEIVSTYSRGDGDKTHFNEDGAKKMADFIKELACNSDSGDANFCKQFTE